MPEVFDYFLTYGNSAVGDTIHAIEAPRVHLVHEPRVIKGFRHKQALIDNRYPAVIYEYPFVVTTIGSSVVGYLHDYYRFAWLWDLVSAGPTSARTLKITNSSGTSLMSMGACWCDDVDIKEPSELLVHKAGLVGVKFLGTSAPVLS